MIKKNILIICSSSVAIIKAKQVIDGLKEKNNVEVILTDATRSGYANFADLETIKPTYDLGEFPNHIKWSKWADIVLVIPATANTIAKFYHTIGDTFASSTLLGTRVPVIFVPAMNTFMYKKLIDRKIILNLENEGHMFIGPVNGLLKEGETGMGRMVEPKEIIERVENYLNPKKQKVLLPYGRSIVRIDPVRYISNNSSGTMGRILSNELRLKGFDVHSIDISKYSNYEFMELVKDIEFDIYISPAAFADFDVDYSESKIKKQGIDALRLKPNLDIISELKKIKPQAKYFAFKLDDDKTNAINKKTSLGLDGIIWNKISAMNSDVATGEIMFNENIPFKNLTKEKLALLIANQINKM